MAYHGEDTFLTSPGKAGINGPDTYLWDTPKFAMESIFENTVMVPTYVGSEAEDVPGPLGAPTVYPKLKHWYKGEFPGKLSGIDWLIKTMDKPKIDIESVEQIRNNVKRHYPVRYNFGDLSLTFWDDVHHDTITTINEFFHGSVWEHGDKKGVGDKKGAGTLLLRDSIVIPEFKVIEYSIENSHAGSATFEPITYTFHNAVLSSFDFDGSDDEGDETVPTVQVVFKIEGYSLSK